MRIKTLKIRDLKEKSVNLRTIFWSIRAQATRGTLANIKK